MHSKEPLIPNLFRTFAQKGAEQSSVILSDETGQCLFTIQDNQVVRSFKDESFYLPLVYCKDFDRFIL